jgi:hypothetical protein
MKFAASKAVYGERMRIFFAAYCNIKDENPGAVPEVYRRALRIALEMVSRGHEVWMFCLGRQGYQDDLTCEAEGCIHFLDFPLRLYPSPRAELRSRCFRMALRRMQPDLMVVGEAPLDGTLLEFTIAAVKLGIRMVLLDHVCALRKARAFIAVHGSMFDGIVLNGPSSLHMRHPPKYYCPAPPYIEGSPAEAEILLNQCGIRPKHWITVLAYEKKVQQFAATLLPSLAAHDIAAVFLAPAPKECRKLLAATTQFTERTIVLPPSNDNLRFGLLQRSGLVIGKCDFTQMSEALALGAPFLGITYEGCFRVRYLPPWMRRFVYAADVAQSDRETLDAAVHLMLTPHKEMLGVHDGRFGAAAMVADFLERLPAARQKSSTAKSLQRYLWKCELSGFLEELFAKPMPQFRRSAGTRAVQRTPGTPIQIRNRK